MDIAKEKRSENIAEYILYLWQLEDLLRAMQFNSKAVFNTLVAPRDASDEWKMGALEWYMEMANLLQEEAKEESGHLNHTLHIITDMNDLHLILMQQPAGKEYRELFTRLAPNLPGLRQTIGKDVSDIELAFRALYAAMLYRIKGEKGAVADEVTVLVSPVIAKLSELYHKTERGEIDLYKSEQ